MLTSIFKGGPQLKFHLKQISRTLSIKIRMQPTFNKVPEKESFPLKEEEIQRYWSSIKAFETQLKKTEGCPEYSFYDGPPFATGLPHYGNLLAGTTKDICTRYASMNGFHVARNFGWDCHGLPVEYEVDKLLGIKGHEDYQSIGLRTYNDECRKIIMRYSTQWRDIVSRYGRWIDFDNDYKTMDIGYMQSIWWIFKRIYDQGFVYRGSKCMPLSTACGTVLSNFEAKQNYMDVTDPSLVVTFPLISEPNTKLLAWTTTPWTLPSNLLLVCNPAFKYLKIQVAQEEFYIFGEPHMKEVCKMLKLKNPKVVSTFLGKELEGLEYIPLFKYYEDYRATGCFRVVIDDYVTADTGTGIVHSAPGFGEDDLRVGLKYKAFPPDKPPSPVDQNGRFMEPVTEYKGKYVKDCDKDIMKYLKAEGRLIFSGTIVHSYPHCWRSETPLLYKSVQSWFIKVPEFKERLMANNLKARWVPAYVQEKRFQNWLMECREWCFSRNRYWGNPIPLWVSDDYEEIVCVGSIEELKQLSGVPEITDMHRDYIDQITIPSKQGKGTLHRINEVFDCWFESGSMPFAQFHYPFEISEEDFMKKFPADFISEGLDQTRGWFYTLNVISTLVKDTCPFKNLIVHGIILAEDGKKMSKRLQNYPPPMELATKIGVDPVRLYMITSPVVKAENLKFKEQEVRDVVKNVILPWQNAYRFLVQNVSRWELQTGTHFIFDENLKENLDKGHNVMDRWIIAANQNLVKFIREEMAEYRLYTVVPKLLKFLEELTNWYVRLNRLRLKGSGGPEDWLLALNSLFDVLLSTCALMAPYTPFLVEAIYLNLSRAIKSGSPLKEESVHFLRIPKYSESLIDEEIEERMGYLQKVIELGRVIRAKAALPVKTPLQSLLLISDDLNFLDHIKGLEYYIKEELNLLQIHYSHNEEEYLLYTAKPNFRALGERLGSKFTKEVKKQITNLSTDQIKEYFINKQLSLLDVNIQEGDLICEKCFLPKYLVNKEIGCLSDEKCGVLIDLKSSPLLNELKLGRTLATNIQKLRKEIGVNVEDPVEVFYEAGSSEEMEEVMSRQKEGVEKVLKVPFLSKRDMPEHYVPLAKGNFKSEELALQYLICPVQVNFNYTTLKELLGEKGKDEEYVQTIKKYVLAFGLAEVKRQTTANNGKFNVNMGEVEYVLELGKHYFYGTKA